MPENCPKLVVLKRKNPVMGRQKFRLVIDHRKVNYQIEANRFPLPNITDIYDRLRNATLFSNINLSQRYYQVILKKTARLTISQQMRGHYQLTRLFSFFNSQRAKNLRNYRNKETIAK